MSEFLIILLGIILIFLIRSIKSKLSGKIDDLDNSLNNIRLEIQKLEARKLSEKIKSAEQSNVQPEIKTDPTVAAEKSTPKAPQPEVRWSKPVAESVDPDNKKDIVIQKTEEPKPEEQIIKPAEISTPIPPVKKETPVLQATAETRKPDPEREIEMIRIQEPIEEKKEAAPIQPPQKQKDLESLLGGNWLSKIGIATLVLGIGYFVKYAIDQNWINEIGRVAIGILCGGALIGVAHKLSKNYRTFSSILIGGGISVLYITIVLAFWEYELFSQSIAFTLLILITALSVFLSIAYNKQELAVFSLLGGFASPLMVSSGSGNYIILFSYLLILNTGMLVLSFFKRWKLIDILSYVLTQIFLWSWLLSSYEDQYIGASVFCLLFYIQFYLLAMIGYFKQEKKISAFQAIIILSSNLSLFASLIYIFNDYPVNLKGGITVTMALLNAIPLGILIKGKTVDKNMLYLLIAIVLSFVSLAIPIQLNGCVITLFWAAETIILLFLYKKSSMTIFRTGYFIIQALVLVSLFIDWIKLYNPYYDANALKIVLNEPFITSMVVIISFWINNRLIRKYGLSHLFGEDAFNLSTLLSIVTEGLLFVSLLIELCYQMNVHFDSTSFIMEVTGLYILSFIAIYVWVKKWKSDIFYSGQYVILLFTIAFYTTFYMWIVYRVREDILFELLPGWKYFALHYLSIPAIVAIYIYVIRKNSIVNSTLFNKGFIYWFTAISSVIILSLELDNTAIMLFSGRIDNELLLSYCHNIAYPILWGIISFILMAIGMKRKNQALRIISLSLFALIIAKLYLYDIWKMNQAGRIIAFIFLGILFLIVSFLYQKLKVILAKEKNMETKENEETHTEFNQ